MSVIKIRQSELKSFKICRRKTDLAFWQGLQRLPNQFREPNKADGGTLVHTCLEFYYRDGIHPVVTLERLASEMAQGTPLKWELWKKTFTLCKVMLNGYMDWIEREGADVGLLVTGVEREISVPFGSYLGNDIEIVGHIDLEAIDSLARPVLIDHKTVDTFAEVGGPMDDQRLTYAVLRRLEDGTEYAALMHNRLRRCLRTAQAKPPFYDRPEVRFNTAQLDAHEAQMRVLVREILDARHLAEQGETAHLYPNPHRDCSWSCPFFQACPMFDDGSDVEWYLNSEFVAVGAYVPGQEEA